MMNKKGVIDQLTGLVIGLVIVGIVLAIAFLIFAEVAANASVVADGNATAAVNEVITATAGIPGWLPIIIVAVVGVLLLGLIMMLRRK